jgi:chromate reductase
MEKKLKILGFVGSLRKESFNKTLIRTAIEIAPKEVEIEIFDLLEIPPFNQDNEAKPPQIVKEFKAKIKLADALLIATPKYNFSIPGVLKNAIDWASRPYTDKVFDGKPVALMSASTGRLGGARAQYHLRQSFVFLNMHPINHPEVMLSNAQQHIDENGKVINEKTCALIRQLIEELVRWTKRLKQKT